jgi:hypothetical protein
MILFNKLSDGATRPQDVLENKSWADLFVELQEGDLGHENGLRLDTLIEGLIALCLKRSSSADSSKAHDERFYMNCISKFTQLLIFINTPQPLSNKPYMKREEGARQLKSLVLHTK